MQIPAPDGGCWTLTQPLEAQGVQVEKQQFSGLLALLQTEPDLDPFSRWTFLPSDVWSPASLPQG